MLIFRLHFHHEYEKNITGIIKSRNTNICPEVHITEGNIPITYKGDQIKIQLTTQYGDIEQLTWDLKDVIYDEKFLSLNSQESNGNTIIFDVLQNFKANNTLKINNLRINKITENIDDVHIKITNNNQAHKYLNIEESNSLKFMIQVNPYIQFVYNSDIMFSDDYVDYECKYKNIDQIELRLFHDNKIKTFWEDDIALVLLPKASGAKWSNESHSNYRHFVSNFSSSIRFDQTNTQNNGYSLGEAYLEDNDRSESKHEGFNLKYFNVECPNLEYATEEECNNAGVCTDADGNIIENVNEFIRDSFKLTF